MTAPNRVVAGYKYIVGSSDLGSCLKAQTAELLGYDALPTSERMRTLYNRGHEHEDECIGAMIHKEGWSIGQRQAECVIDCGDGWGVVVHLDGIGNPTYMTTSDRQFVVEVKSPSTWHSFKNAVGTHNFSNPFMDRLAWQLSSQLVSTGLEAVVACVEEGVVRTFGIEVPIYSLRDIQVRVMEIKMLVEMGAVPSACSSADYPCPFAYLHEDPPVDIDPELDELGLQRARLLAERKSLDLGIKDIEDAIKARCNGQNIKTELVTVTTYTQAGPAKWDTDLMEADGVPVDKYRVAGKPSVRTRITTRGE